AAMVVGTVEGRPEPLIKLSTTGLLRGEAARTIEQWIDAGAAAGLIRVSEDQYRTLSLTSLGRELMAGRLEDVQMAVPRARPASMRRRRSRRAARKHDFEASAHGAKPVDAVVEALRAWRLNEARQRTVAPFVVL